MSKMAIVYHSCKILTLGLIAVRTGIDAFTPVLAVGDRINRLGDALIKCNNQKRNEPIADENNSNHQIQRLAVDLDDLAPPVSNFDIFQRPTSSLFDESPVSGEENGPLMLWRQAKSTLPSILTGAWENDTLGDDNPVGALYNMVFVRIPAFGMSGVYIKNLIGGHPLVMNFGYGWFEMSPFIVLIVMMIILGPGPQMFSENE